MQLLDNLKLRIRQEKLSFISSYNKKPKYILLDRESYSLLKESLGIPAYNDIPDYDEMMIHIVPLKRDYIDFL